MDQIEHLNTLALQWSQEQVPMTTTEELRQFFENPPKRAYSIPLEESRTLVIKAFQQGNGEDRRTILSKLNSAARDGFLDYAACMAVLAVRTKSPDLIEQGLIALLIEGGGLDLRDSVITLAQLYHSATKLGMDVQDLFERTSRLTHSEVTREMKGFPQRRPQDRCLRAFNQTEEITSEGFRYTSIPFANR